MKLRLRVGTIYLCMAVLAMLGLAMALLAVSFVPYQELKPQVDALTFQGSAASFTPSFYARMVSLVRAASIVPILLSVLLFVFRRQVGVYTSSLVGSFSDLLTSLIVDSLAALRKENPVHLVALGTIILIACAVRVSFLFQPMRYDEAYTFTHYASTPFFAALSNYSAPNNHLLHTALVRVSYLMFGSDPWALRLPALISGILVVPATYAAGRVFYGGHAGLLAAGLVAASSPLIEYSTNARGYSMVVLFFLLILVLTPRLLDSRSTAGWVSLGLLSALGFYTVPTMLYPSGLVMLWLLLSIVLEKPAAERRDLMKGLVASAVLAGVVTVVLYLPVLLVWGPNALVGNQFVAPKSWDNLVRSLPGSALSTWDQWNQAIPGIVTAVLMVGFAVSLVFHRVLSKHRVPLVLAAALWIVPVVLVQRVVPYERVWLFLIPLFMILSSAGLAGVAYPWRLVPVRGPQAARIFALLAVGLSLALSYNVVRTQSVYWSDETGTLRDAEAITLWMKGHLMPGDSVFAVGPSYGPLEYYFRVNGLSPSEYWYSESAAWQGRMFLVVNEQTQSLETVMRSLGKGRAGYSDPVLVQRYPGAGLYEMVPQ